MTLRTDAELDAALRDLAAAEGVSRQEIIRRAVIARRDRALHSVEVAASSQRMIERWNDVLDRLGTV